MKSLKTGLALTLILIAGCSTQSGYEAMKEAAEHQAKCHHIVDAQEAERCKQQFEKPYRDYEREREEALKK